MIGYCEKEAVKQRAYRSEIEKYVNVLHEDILKMEDNRFKDRST